MQFDYFYGNEAEQFTFYRIPKVLISSPQFKTVSDSAKLLYGLMLDRMSLSVRNGWFDEQNRAYIFFTVKDIMELMCCATEKATKITAELDSEKGIGLIERVKQGQGKPAKIYLKKFISDDEDYSKKSRFSEIEIQDFGKPKTQTFENRNSRVSTVKSADFRKSKCNNTDNNYTEFNDTDLSNINPINSGAAENTEQSEWLIDRYNKTIIQIKEQIDYDSLINTNDAEIINNIVNVMADVMLLDIQSFKPGEVTPELAHSIGVQFAKECFGDRFEVVIGTHLDRGHLHNHIVVNSVSFLDGGKFRSTPKSYYNIIRKISDRLCRENKLSVIDNPQHRGMHYAEWKALNEGKPTIRGQVREELDEIIKASYTMQIFWRELKRRGYVVHRKGENIKYTSIIPPFGKRPVRLDKLGVEYTEAAIQERITAARNGIRTMPPSQRRKTYRYNGNLKTVPRKKLKGFQALYFRYLYLFKKIRKKQTPQRVSFFMRDEIIRFERYQKQFKFLYSHGIETAEQLQVYQSEQERQIEELTGNRKNLYNERNYTDEQGEISQQISEINGALKVCRTDVRMCKAIFTDADRIKEKYHKAQELQTQAIENQKEVTDNELKRRSR